MPKTAKAIEKPWKGDRWKMPGFLNWPPSRGPMPPSMRTPPRYDVPEPDRKDGEPRRLTRLRIVNTGAVAGLGLPAVMNEKGKAMKPTKADLRARARLLVVNPRMRRSRRKLKPLPPTPGSWSTNIHVDTLASLTLLQALNVVYVESAEIKRTEKRVRRRRADRWRKRQKAMVRYLRFPREAIRTRIDYPLNVPLDLVVKPYSLAWRRHRASSRMRGDTMNPAYFLWVLAREYRRIYRQHRRYGIWGHAIGDLWFERIRIMRPGKDGIWRAELSVGS